MQKRVCARRMLAAVWLMLYVYTASAQTPSAVATYPRAAVDFSGIVAKTQTTPMDDSVFDYSPEKLGLLFPQKVHLVKLILSFKVVSFKCTNFFMSIFMKITKLII